MPSMIPQKRDRKRCVKLRSVRLRHIGMMLAALASGPAQNIDPEVLQRARIKLHMAEEVAKLA